MASPDRFLLAAVMGWPISQSRSPMLHNFWFAQHGLAGSYVPLAIPPERLEVALRALPSLNFAGCNLTIPLKQDAMRIVDEVDITAKRIGAMSCVVVRKDGSLSGSNNDWYGFTHNILEFVPDWRADAGPVAVMSTSSTIFIASCLSGMVRLQPEKLSDGSDRSAASSRSGGIAIGT